MRMHLWLVACAIVMGRVDAAEACACCDAKMTRTPIGWSAEGSLLIDTRDNHACEGKARLETWPVDAEVPSTCFDFYGDPEKEIPCGEIEHQQSGKTPKRTSAVAKKRFPTKATRSAASKVRVTRSPGSDSGHANATVQVKTKSGWQIVWSGAISSSQKPTASVWPSPAGDRVVALVSYIHSGTQSEEVDVHWAPMPK